MFDSDGYPTDESLEKLGAWDFMDHEGWLKFATELWYWPDYASEEGGVYTFVTGGWSGNESVIGSMQENSVLWSRLWFSSQRGGRYVFKLNN